MNAVLLVVVDVLTDHPIEMGFVERDDVVEQLAATTAYPALRDAVLPRCPNPCARRVQTGGLQKRDHVAVKRRVVVEQYEAMGAVSWKDVTELLYHPRRRRHVGHVEMEDLAPSVVNDEEAREQLKVNVGTVKKSRATITS